MLHFTPPVRSAFLISFAGALVLAGCGGSSTGESPTGSPGDVIASSPVDVPEILSFQADPASVVEGDSTELSWTVSDPAAAVKVSPLRDQIEGTSTMVAPVTTTTYTLTVTNGAGSDSATVVVGVVSKGAVAAPGSGDPDAVTAVGEWLPVAANLVDLTSECGNLAFVSSHPQRDMVITGVARNGLWASIDGSADWAPLGSFGGDAILNRTTSIIYDPNDPDTFWESGTYSGPAVAKTTNGGATFEALGDVPTSDGLSVDLDDPDRQTLLSVTHERAEVWRSQNGGRTWENITGGLPANIGFTSSVLLLDADTYLVGTRNSFATDSVDRDDVGVYRTDDGGFTWRRVFDAPVVGMPLEATDGTIYWLLADGRGMITSIDGGVTWERVTGNGPGTPDALSVIELPGGRIATTGGNQVITSTDRGATWTTAGPRMPFDVNGIAYSQIHNALYAWHWDCTPDLVDDSIARLDLEPLPPVTPAEPAPTTEP
jgi:hypothetical protein